MKRIALPLLTALLLLTAAGPGDLTAINRLKKQAETAIENQDWTTALDLLNQAATLEDDVDLLSPSTQVNLGNLLYIQALRDSARNPYQEAMLNLQGRTITGNVANQLGVILHQKSPEGANQGPNFPQGMSPQMQQQLRQQQGNDRAKAREEKIQNLRAAMEEYRKALRANPNNEEARYNYELAHKQLKKLEEEQQEEQQDQQQQDQENQENQDQENQEQQEQEQEGEQNQEQEQQQEGEGQEENQQGQQQEEQQQEGEPNSDKNAEEEQEVTPEEQQAAETEQTMTDEEARQQELKERLQQLNLSQERLEQMLRSMDKFYQERKRTPKKRPESGKPDW